MKKVLFATSALVATAGIASADMSLSGSGVAGLKDNGTDTTAYTELDFTISGSGTSDNGISFGASIDVEADYANGAEAKQHPNDAEAFVSGEFGTVTIGAVGALNDFGAGDVGFDGIGAESLTDYGLPGGDVSWTYSVNGVALGVAADTATDDMSYSVGFSFSGVDVTVAGAEFDNGDSDVRVKASTSFGPLSATVLVTDTTLSDVDHGGVAMNIGYALNDALTVSAAFAQNDIAADADSSGVGFSYNLGGGLSLAGAAGTNSSDVDVAELGFKMAF
jgi:outer membrane protein OmpU